MKKYLIFFMLLGNAVVSMAQNRTMDTITFVQGGQLYQFIVYTDSILVNGHMIRSSTSAIPSWVYDGTNIYNANAGNVGIGTSSPSFKFEAYSSDPADNIYSRIKTSDYSSQLFNRLAYSGRPDSLLNESEILTSSSGVRFGLTSYYNGWKAWFNLTPDTMSVIPYITDKDGNAMIGRLGLGTNLSPWGDTYLSKLYMKTPRYSGTSTRTLGIDTITGEIVKIPNAAASDTSLFAKAGNNIWAKNSGNIGFGVTNPSYKIDALTSGAVGVHGKSTSAAANNPYGVWGESAGMGVFGSGGKYGFYGSGTIAGVYGSSTGAAGVYGETSTNRGVIGVATGSGGWGVTGSSDLSYGVVAYSGSGIPVYAWVNPSSTNTSLPLMTLARTTSGTSSAGIGGYLQFENESYSGGGVISSRFGSTLTRVENTHESGSLEWWTRKDGTLAKKMELDSTGNLTLSGSGAILDMAGDKMRIRTTKTPSSATDTGDPGTVCWDANYYYICTATNTWKRTAISTW